MLKKLAHFVLFGNYYLAACIVALSFESVLKYGRQPAGLLYYAFVFFSVVVYYTHAYLDDGGQRFTSNPRALWYRKNKGLIRITQIVFTTLIAITGLTLLVIYWHSLAVFTIGDWALFLLFPFLALLYYGVIFPARFRFKLRNIAWLKPFIIGFVCTGIIVIYPLLFYSLQREKPFELSTATACYFLTNWLFTTAIAIMFDIKDFAADHNYHLKTFVVAKGLRYTLFFILLPLATASLVSFLCFAYIKSFSLQRIFLNTIPFLLLLIAATSLRRRKGILYYLVVIDGLLLVKAAFGIAAMLATH